MAREASSAKPVDPASTGYDQSGDDRLDYDNWLLPCVPPSPGERIIRLCSVVSGPLLLAVGLVGVISWLA